MQILTTSWVVPVVAPPIRNGRVAVEGERIVWVGGASEAGQPEGSLRDLGPGVLLPGLVNAHCHLELSHLRGRLQGAPGFTAWVEALVGMRGDDLPALVRGATSAAVRSLEEAGTVAVGDVSNALAHLDLLAESSLTAVVFHELLGFDPDQAASLLEAAEARLAGLDPGLSRRGVVVRLAAHAPQSVSAALLEGLRRRGGPAAIHLAESAAESRFLLAGDGEWRDFLARRGLGGVRFTPPGLSPVGYLDSLGALPRGLVAAHAVHVDEADRRTLAARGVHVVLCPRSNRALRVGLAPVPELLAAGVPLALGTDSLASAETLNLMDDVAALHREFPCLEPGVLVAMATEGGARALGLPDLGAIAPGRRAALAFDATSEPPEDPLLHLVSGGAAPRRVAL